MQKRSFSQMRLCWSSWQESKIWKIFVWNDYFCAFGNVWFLKNAQKRRNFRKGVDKRGEVWYSNKAVGAVSAAPESGRKNTWQQPKSVVTYRKLPLKFTANNVENFLKKFLTKRADCGNLKKLLKVQNWVENIKNFWKKYLTNSKRFCKISNVPPGTACTL